MKKVKIIKNKVALFTIDGKVPSVGDTFYYSSKHANRITEGTVLNVGLGNITSKNGVIYRFNEITLKPRSEIRNEIINSILG